MLFKVALGFFLPQICFAITLTGPAKYMGLTTGMLRPTVNHTWETTVGFHVDQSQNIVFGAKQGPEATVEIESILLKPVDVEGPLLDLTNKLSLAFIYNLDSKWTRNRLLSEMRESGWPNVTGSYSGHLLPFRHQELIKNYLSEIQRHPGLSKARFELQFMGKTGEVATFEFVNISAFHNFISTEPIARTNLLQRCALALKGMTEPFKVRLSQRDRGLENN